jgi:peptidoglycan/xylan/chitin deacetylase (PgdA/CDA1 family)
VIPGKRIDSTLNTLREERAMSRVKIGLCVDPVGNAEEVSSLCQMLREHSIRATVTAAGTVGKKSVSTLDYLRPFLEGGHEIANHTRSHPPRIGQLEKEEQEEEILQQHQRLMELGREYGTPFAVNGFRAPLYAYEQGVFEVLRRLGYGWDSSALYSPLLGIPFKPFVLGGILEIPVLLPDDVTLLDRMFLAPEDLFQVWWQCYERTERYFVFTVHPYGSARDRRILNAFNAFVERMAKGGGTFLTLSEMADDIRQRL